MAQFGVAGAAAGVQNRLDIQAQQALEQQKAAQELQNALVEREYKRILGQAALAQEQRLSQPKPAEPRFIEGVSSTGQKIGRLVSPQELQSPQGVPMYTAPTGGTAPVRVETMQDNKPVTQFFSPQDVVGKTFDARAGSTNGTTEWVLRGKQAIEIPRGTSQPGDRPYQQPSAAAVTVQLGDQGLDMTAKMYAKTGQLPPMGMGASAAAARAKIIDRAAQYDPATDSFGSTTSPDLASNKAGYGADTQALNQLQKNFEAVSAFETTVKANTELLNATLAKLPGQTSITLLNAPIRSAATIMGNEDMARFNALRQSIQNEYARIISNPNLVGVLSDAARKEMATVLAPNATVGQIKAALDALSAEADNRRMAFGGQISDVKNRIKGGPSAPAAAPAGGSSFRVVGQRPAGP